MASGPISQGGANFYAERPMQFGTLRGSRPVMFHEMMCPSKVGLEFEAEAMNDITATVGTPVIEPGESASVPGALVPSVAGILGALALIGLYLGLVTWAQGFSHARELMREDRYFVAAIAGGFGLQIALFVHLRRLLSARAKGSAGVATAAGTSTSTAAMLACCAHHVVDALPVLGLSGLAIFLNDYRVPVMMAGITVNIAGVLFMARLVVIERRHANQEESCSAP